MLLLLRPARLRRRGGGGSGSGDSPGGGGGARSSLPLSSPGRLRGPYLGPPRLGPWTARGWGMAAHSSSVPASGFCSRTQTGTPQPLSSVRAVGWSSAHSSHLETEALEEVAPQTGEGSASFSDSRPPARYPRFRTAFASPGISA